MLYKKGDKILDYQVSFPLNKGLYAESYRVKDKKGNLRFLKLISYNQLAPSQFDLSGNIREVKLAKVLNHKNLTKYIESHDIIIQDQKYCCLVTEFVSCETLDKALQHRRFSEYEIKKIIISVLHALEYLHNQEHQIVHNDVTAHNVIINLIGDYNDLKLIDLGNACSQGEIVPLHTQINERDIFYIAPERFTDGKVVPKSDIKSDLFSVGVLMYNLLFKEQPWFVDLKCIPIDLWIPVIKEARNQKLLLPEFSNHRKNGLLVNIMLKALELDPSNRFKNARDFIDAIEGTYIVSRNDCNISCETTNAPFATTQISRRIGNGFADVAGMENLKQMIRSDVIEILNDKERAKSLGLSIPNGILFYGPPGCGKTFFAEKLAEEMKCNYMYIKCSDVASPYIHGGQEKIAAIFSDARKKAPSIIFLDEIDAMLKDRSKHNNVSESGEVNEFLAQMNNCGKDGLLVIAATNQPNEIDAAALRAGRIELKYYIDLPEAKTRKQLFEIELQHRNHEDTIFYDDLVSKTDGYSCADIKLVIDTAARIAFRSKVYGITMEHIKEACDIVKPSLSSSMIKKYQAIRERFEGISANRPKIGFN